MKELYKALANFQQEVPVIHKGTEGYGYQYTDMPAIFEVINPLLKSNGLGFTQLVNENTLKTILFHVESGEQIESTTSLISNVRLAKMNEFQVLGSQITYLRRYALSSMLGIVTDKDIDGAGDQLNDKDNDDDEPEKPWLNRADKSGVLSANYTKIISEARKKGLKLNDLMKYYKISKDNQEFVKSELGG